MSGGTEAFPDLGRHCQHHECHQLDFLPFTCEGCQQVFCLEHRSYKAHTCPKSDHNSRKVVVCDVCSTSIEITGRGQGDDKAILEKHDKSGECDPTKKKKPTCAVRRCKEILTFSNTCVCKTCQIKVCLKHRFPADHHCKKPSPANPTSISSRFLLAFASRNAKDCCKNDNHSFPMAPSSIRSH
ncbi:Zinc finger AN1 domain-containing stress-associated protein 12 [Linum perenne]